MAVLELDYMEYANDGAAQAAYVSSDKDVVPTDPYSSDAYTKLLLHCDGADESVIIPDSGNTNHGNATVYGTAQLDTTQKQFGTASLWGDGDSDYISFADHNDWNFAAGDFTVDFWFRLDTFTVDDIMIAQWDAGDEGWMAYYYNGYLHFQFSYDGSTDQYLSAEWTPTLDTWYHYAAVRSGADMKLYINGVQVGSTFNVSTNTIYDSSQLLTIGARAQPAGFLHGWIDEVRISKGIARWTSNFNVPNLQCYSEDTIKQQGSYSLKVVAQQTGSLNDTLTKSGLSLDLTDKDTLKLWAYASRTGTNIQIQIHDSGGTTSTKDIVISSATTWTEITWDISGISNVNKDDIDSIIIKIINADDDNTFYIDNFYAPVVIVGNAVLFGINF